MCEPEGQHLIPLVGGCYKIFSLFSLSHGTPLAISNSAASLISKGASYLDSIEHLLVPPDIEKFTKHEQGDIVDADADENLIAPPIHRLVIVAINLCSHGVSQIQQHGVSISHLTR
jgi:hypothetical protein